MSEKKFEEAMKRLENIVESLERGDLSLEESLKIFEEGMKLLHFCSKKLEEAEAEGDAPDQRKRRQVHPAAL